MKILTRLATILDRETRLFHRDGLPSETMASFEAQDSDIASMSLEDDFFTVELGEGDHGSINIGWWNNGVMIRDPNMWLSQGYKGIRFVGRGIDRTHIRPTTWDGITVAIRQHNGIVRFENCTIHAYGDTGVRAGEQNTAHRLSPNFAFHCINVRFVTDPSPDGSHRTKWLALSYQCDIYLKGCIFDGKESVEHDFYTHGYSRQGVLIEDCQFRSAGAEGFKARPDQSETVWVPNARIVIRRSMFADWHQPWSWRGGAAIVLQHSHANVLIERCVFRGGSPMPPVTLNNRSHAIMLSSEGGSYDTITGAVGSGFGQGFVLVRECALYGHSDFDWSNEIIRCARNSGSAMSARGILIEGCGVWGQLMLARMSQIPPGMGVIRGCNTPSLKEYCSDILGMDTSREAMYPGAGRKIPLSEGIVV